MGEVLKFVTLDQARRFPGGSGPPKGMHWGGPKSKGPPNKNKVCYLSWILTK